MRWLLAALVGCLLLTLAHAAPQRPEFQSTDAVLRWIDGYRAKPDLASVPHAMRTLSKLGAFRDSESAGAYIGFLAGIVGANPTRAEETIAAILPLPDADQWVVVRAIAYSDLPDWKGLMIKFITRLPARQTMINKYLLGELPLLNQPLRDGDPPSPEQIRRYLSDENTKRKDVKLDPTPELLDTLWGYYFATGGYGPISRIIAMLPWAKDASSVERVALGNMARFTLASNASRDQVLLKLLHAAARRQPKAVEPILNDVIDAAETMSIARIRRDALASIEDYKRKSADPNRNVSWWGQAGLTGLSAGCLVAAATGHVELGLPCVLGGALSQAALRMWATQ